MSRRINVRRLLWVALSACGLCSTGMGCFQTTVGGQTLPSAYYLDDDVQYFPAGPETKLSNQIRSIEQYKLERRQAASGDSAY